MRSISSGVEHVALVHSGGGGRLVVWTPREGRHWHSIPAADALPLLKGLDGKLDVFVTPNVFHGWRVVRHLRALNALYIDIDAGLQAEPVVVLDAALSALARAQVPDPTLGVFSGRGVHLYWLIQPVPAEALSRWQACQRRLQQIVGSDPKSLDCTRVLRVIGTKNPKALPERQTVTGLQLCGGRYQFDWLADQILPLTRGEIRDLRAGRARAKIPLDQARGHQRNIYQWWMLVYRDLVQIIEWHWFGSVPEGQRDNLLFLLAVALSWFTRAEALETEIAATARQLTPTLTEKEALSYTSSVVRRACQSAAGHTATWNGDARDPRYWFRRQTLWERLSPLIPNELEAELRAIVSGPERARRRRARDAARNRVDEGRYRQPHGGASEQEEARRLRAAGLSVREIAIRLGVAKSTVQDWVRLPNTNSSLDGFARRT